jgi:DNA repair protein RadC
MTSEYKITAVPTKDSNLVAKKITSPNESADYARMFFHEDIVLYESFFIILLDRGNYTKAWAKISQGGVSGTVVDIKIIAKYIVDTLASGVILVHNHPSGNTTPSENDKKITDKIQNACKYLDCSLLDHIILTKDSYFSFAKNGLI